MEKDREPVKTRIWGRALEGSYTVEAALIMATILFLMAALLANAFRIHSRVTADMVMQNAMEQVGHKETGIISEEILEKANRSLHGYYRCGDKQIKVEEHGKQIEGTVLDRAELYKHEISVRVFDPEGFLRLIRAIGI